jgi:RNA polymerase sigma-70 factor (ECF subfamily)
MTIGTTVIELEALYRGRYRAFLRVAAAVAGDEARGADAVQDAFVRAITSRAAFRGDAPLEAWVWRIVVNAARAARLRPESVLPLGFAANSSAEASEPDIDAWIAALPERERLVVFLRYFADLDYRGIATVLGVKVGTVSATLHSARATLRRSLEEAPT